VRRRLHEAALAAGRAVGYVRAGTVEFLGDGDGDDAGVYFLEVNTRLQVDHPVNEAITGLVLVRAQILVAAGEPLPFLQSDVTVTGHAVECRVYAEDSRRLLPQTGRLLHYREPGGEGVRVDSGVEEGQSVTVHYDPLLAKVITHGTTRGEALDRMTAALSRFDILGLRHNIGFLLGLLHRPEVREARVDTGFIEGDSSLMEAPPASVAEHAAALAAFAAARASEPAPVAAEDGDLAARDPWDLLGPVTW
jgi:3-methylcrotonyl-CoA carboxylase alpha subunit